ncbi:uncharacterized protein KY384_008831 [Bacidia gigantensis]|uniref:uncharacterized protein n=1 Tax=Bacidia gigantensis TaxID=2732470 RepID=UPI001D041007|nr:uncharacterized protein KY384_008831 [Bacidia gigantensis]KAG8526630.1 hypothetical protein KY384_008831 [Bacidia gigantensis]
MNDSGNDLDLSASQLNQALASDLIEACKTGNVSRLQTLFPQYQKAPPASVPSPQFLLQVAARTGQAETVRAIWSLLPPENHQPPHHPWNPRIPPGVYFNSIPRQWRIYEDGIIHEALMAEEPLEVFKFFFEHGMKPDHNLDRAINIMAQAISHNHVNLARFLLEQGAKPTGRYIQPEDTYLGEAARKPSSDMLKLLLQHGARLEGSQALRQAAEAGQLRNAGILLESGADVNEVFTRYDWVKGEDQVMGCALHFAVKDSELICERQVSKVEMIQFLLSRGARLDVVDGEGLTPRQIAANMGEAAILEVLRQHENGL